jgi:heptosyltransferase-1
VSVVCLVDGTGINQAGQRWQIVDKSALFYSQGLSTILACGFSLLNHNGLAQASVTMRAMMNVLIVRTSSMGDLIHTWPAITELKTHYPNLRISWLAEENFADIPRLHPAVEQVIPMAWRRWRKRLFAADTRAEMKAVYQQLQATQWDLVVDCQGLLKSAIPAKLSRGPLAGYDRHSIREPLACLLYDKTHRVDWSLSAVERCRLLLAKVFGYQPEGSPRFGVPAAARPDWLAQGEYAVLLHATSRASKEWPEQHWIALGEKLAAQHGLQLIIPWGNAAEQQRASGWLPPCRRPWWHHA